jgi:hypothetical protein
MGYAEERDARDRTFNFLILMLVGAALLCGLLGMIFSQTAAVVTEQGFTFRPTIFVAEPKSQNAVQETASNEKDDPTVGQPVRFRVLRANTLYLVTLQLTNLPNQSWFNAEVVLEDEKGNFLVSFVKELWHESGYDDGHWEEQDQKLKLKFTIEEPGVYVLKLRASANQSGAGQLKLEELVGGSYPAYAGLFLFLLLAIALSEWRYKFVSTLLGKTGDDDD